MRQNNKNNPFLGSLRAVAIAIGKRDHIDIKFQGSGAKTDGTTIYLPATLPADDAEIEITLRGFLDHEVGHVKHTNFNIPSAPHPLVHTITNILEDIRIEQLMGLEYPGCAVNLRELTGYLKSIGKIQFKDKANATGATLMAISYGARVKHLRNNLVEEAESYRKLAGKHLGKKALSIIDKAITEAGSLASTQDAQNLALKVYDLLKEASQDPPPPPPQSQQQSEKSKQKQDNKDQQQGEGQGDNGKSDEKEGDKGDKEDKGGAGSGSDKQDSNDQKDSSANDGSGEQNDGQDGAAGGADGGEGDDSSDSDDSPATGGNGAGSQPAGDDCTGSAGDKSQSGPTQKQRQNLEKMLDTAKADLDKIQNDLDISAKAADQINKDTQSAASEGHLPQMDSSGNTGEVVTVRSAGYGGSGAGIRIDALKTVGLRGKLAGLFQSTKLKRDNPQLTGHKLDRRAVHRIAAMTPDTRIFQQRREKVADNTAITILVDRSGSMSGIIGLAVASAFSVAKATESMPGVKCAVSAFPYTGSGVLSLKDFSEKPNADRFAIGATGGTPLDVALRWAGQKLWPRQENRKMVLVLTDGEPNDRLRALEMIKLLEQNDIECYGIGIGSQTSTMVKGLFGEHSKAIDTIEELAGAMFDTISAAITSRR